MKKKVFESQVASSTTEPTLTFEKKKFSVGVRKFNERAREKKNEKLILRISGKCKEIMCELNFFKYFNVS